MSGPEEFFFAAPPNPMVLGRSLLRDAGKLAAFPSVWRTILSESFEILMRYDSRYDTPDFDLLMLPAMCWQQGT